MNESPKAATSTPLSFDSIKERNGKRFETITELATLDAAFRKRLMENPKEVLDEIGMVYPPGFDIMVFEIPKNTIPIGILPFIGQDTK